MKGRQFFMVGEALAENLGVNCFIPEERKGPFALDLLSGKVMVNELGIVVDGDTANRNSLSGFGGNDLYLTELFFQAQAMTEEPSRAFMSLQVFDKITTSVPIAYGVATGGFFMLPTTDFQTFSGVGTYSPVASDGARLFGHVYLHTPSNFRFMLRITQLN